MAELDYYNIEQAANHLGCREDELIHFIETDRIEAALLSKQHQYILLDWDEEIENWIGSGTVFYRGLILPHPSWIKSILEKGEIVLNRPVTALNQENLSNHSFHNPFYGELFPEIIATWVSAPLNENLEEIIICPLPTQKPNGLYALHNLTETVQAVAKSYNPNLKDIKPESDYPKPEPYIFDFEDNGYFELADIRLTLQTVLGLKGILSGDNAPGQESPESAPSSNQNQLSWCKSKKSSRIDEVFERLFQQNRNSSAKELWKILENDRASDLNTYDINEIIETMDISIEWKTQKGRLSELKTRTFDNKLTEIRRFYIRNQL